MPPLIKLEVSEDIAAKIRFMAESGVFEIANGSVTLFFKGGHLTTTKTELYTYAPISEVDIKKEQTIIKAFA